MKKLLFVLILLVIGCYYFYHEKQHSTKISTSSTWFREYPQLGVIAKMESPVVQVPIANISESEEVLLGKITNPLGIRDDVLEYIVKNIPESNPIALKAAIRSAQDNQLIYYGNLTEEEAMKADSNYALSSWCLVRYLGAKKGIGTIGDIDAIMRNTKARDQHMWKIDRKYFSWKVLGSGLSVDGENKACDAGDF